MYRTYFPTLKAYEVEKSYFDVFGIYDDGDEELIETFIDEDEANNYAFYSNEDIDPESGFVKFVTKEREETVIEWHDPKEYEYPE